jgi:MoxR-like ATPase
MSDRPPEPTSTAIVSKGNSMLEASLERLRSVHAQMKTELHRVIVGQDQVIDELLLAILTRGHCLLVGVPGLAKTLMISSLARTLDLSFNRIQFTPDLMPSDITGTDVLEEDPESGKRRFRFVRGPVFTQILLADEINRTPPKTQAALLQSMAEGQVTAGGTTHPLPRPYLVFATQNPIDQEGTYPLPEAQLDRFLMQIDVDYPSDAEEAAIVRRTTSNVSRAPKKVLDAATILALQDLVPRVPVADHVVAYAVSLARGTRPTDPTCTDFARANLAYGAGPRASQALVLAAKARAAMHGRFAAEREDVRALALPILRHRLVPSFRARTAGVSPADVVNDLLRCRPA